MTPLWNFDPCTRMIVYYSIEVNSWKPLGIFVSPLLCMHPSPPLPYTNLIYHNPWYHIIILHSLSKFSFPCTFKDISIFADGRGGAWSEGGWRGVGIANMPKGSLLYTSILYILCIIYKYYVYIQHNFLSL